MARFHGGVHAPDESALVNLLPLILFVGIEP
jgi:hypothetical protein